MTADRRPAVDPLTLSHEGRIDAACDRYEAAWKAGDEPRIETYLDAELETERPALFCQLLALELELRRPQGRATRPPGIRDSVSRILASGRGGIP